MKVGKLKKQAQLYRVMKNKSVYRHKHYSNNNRKMPHVAYLCTWKRQYEFDESYHNNYHIFL